MEQRNDYLPFDHNARVMKKDEEAYEERQDIHSSQCVLQDILEHVSMRIMAENDITVFTLVECFHLWKRHPEHHYAYNELDGY